jgi:hypothetical protein
MWDIKKEIVIVKSEQAKGLTLERKMMIMMMMMMTTTTTTTINDDSVNNQFRFQSFP